MRVRQALAGIGVTAVMLVGTTLPAMAVTYLEVPGAAAKFEGYFDRITLFDIACDDDSVYTEWKTEGGDTIKVANTSGCGTSRWVDIPMANNTKIWFRVCVDKSWPTYDKCSTWDWDIV
ncbi:hypothetical protein OG394_20235 [Kribbella sp. NBC_01245]|uniref:hypothetical protein n=1 Tax=Kribbella sp. NBC_01245 TaxID=2903578 RepID=UPI002E27FC36|nr:hypothetical protein [Kribbella sp. NBC_01245]